MFNYVTDNQPRQQMLCEEEKNKWIRNFHNKLLNLPMMFKDEIKSSVRDSARYDGAA